MDTPNKSVEMKIVCGQCNKEDCNKPSGHHINYWLEYRSKKEFGGIDEFGKTFEEYAINDSEMLNALLRELGWQGGTIHQVKDEILKRFLTPLNSQRKQAEEVLGIVEGMKKKEYTFEHTYPNSFGLMGTDGKFHQTIQAGQKQIMTQGLEDEDIIYNQALSDLATKLKEHYK